MAAWLEFESDVFDHTSELPPDANAGNRFYGRDVAEFIVDGLTARGYESHSVGEDWGWFVRARTAESPTLEISIYHAIGEHRTPGCWALNVENEPVGGASATRANSHGRPWMRCFATPGSSSGRRSGSTRPPA